MLTPVSDASVSSLVPCRLSSADSSPLGLTVLEQMKPHVTYQQVNSVAGKGDVWVAGVFVGGRRSAPLMHTGACGLVLLTPSQGL